VNAFFGIATMIISIPTGVKVFNWLFTMYRGRIKFTTPMLWTVGFITTFTFGGMTGVMMAIPAIDFQVHNSLFLIAHFHNVIIGGVLFGYLAGFTYWFPKAFGFKLNDRLGRYSCYCWIVGFYVAFLPLYVLGFMGMTRRLNHYDASTGWHPWLVVAAIGAVIIACGIVFQILQIIVSIKNRELYRDTTGDAWDGRTLEWSIPSPPPIYNFAVVPHADQLDAFWVMKQKNTLQTPAHYEDIHMPRNTATGFLIGVFAGIFGFAAVWHIYWLAIAGLLAIFAVSIARTFDMDTDYYIRADEVREIESKARLVEQGN